MKIADVHCHIFPDKLAEKATRSIGDFYGDGEMFEPASVGNLVKAHREAGIERCVVCNSAVTAEQVHNINDFIAASCAEHPEFIGFGSVLPTMDGVEEELERMMSMGLRGVKIHPDFQKIAIDESNATDTYRAIAKRGLPVLFHMGDDRYDFSSAERLLNLLKKVPDLRVIAAHLGGWQVWEQALKTPMPENVVYDTSSSTPFLSRDMTLRLLECYGIERCMFGSDFPMWSPKEELERILALGLSQTELEQILYGNFDKFFAV
ncbi:MAG: amidohydrolase family protein [Oscillospiraceae bacterium]|nr:amidohydrolase family protein [Oscillospiraceae bacterium]